MARRHRRHRHNSLHSPAHQCPRDESQRRRQPRNRHPRKICRKPHEERRVLCYATHHRETSRRGRLLGCPLRTTSRSSAPGFLAPGPHISSRNPVRESFFLTLMVPRILAPAPAENPASFAWAMVPTKFTLAGLCARCHFGRNYLPNLAVPNFFIKPGCSGSLQKSISTPSIRWPRCRKIISPAKNFHSTICAGVTHKSPSTTMPGAFLSRTAAY